MRAIDISNDKIEGLTVRDFYNNDNIRRFSVHTGTSTLVPMYKELLREVIGSKVDTFFKDNPLTQEETQAIEAIFTQKIDDTIPFLEPLRGSMPHWRFEWKNKAYDLSLSLTRPMNRKARDFYTIVKICKECLQENKPMYLSIE